MKTTLLTVLTLLVLGNSQQVDIHAKDVYFIVKGVVEGVQVDDHVEVKEIVSCLNDSEALIENIVKAITNLESQTFDGVKEGIKLIGVAIQQIPDAITACESGSEEMVALSKLLTNMLEQLRNPWTFSYKIGYNLIVNGLDIYQEISTAIKDWKSEIYEDFGKQIGFVLVQLLKETKNIEAVILDDEVVGIIFEGLLDGIPRTLKLLNVAGGIVIDFEKAVRLLEDGSVSSVIQALQSFVEGISEFPKALETCQSSSQEAVKLAEKIKDLIEALSNPSSFVYHIGKDLIINGKDIYQEIFAAVDDWKYGKWSDFGFQLGKAMEQIFVGLEKERLYQL
ncbi:unnamed protein product (macronuclear) [Paramecium tetraurelia]|uniref:Uncharacterized protein n=1 Tax=Paramecium tetraurelia TaxID=5888 RepID=A0BK36_PARTE|nr:uncharacterized protein GSPATT00029533001 [Paramecium tetraurelia]CAK58903.1 unnamed protein product [Paramecium tetraurelia]|eukprot:XP_001426301.1 hypothetical protein (macronuclear) [Paramecium tetraurelia strain d4-2]